MLHTTSQPFEFASRESDNATSTAFKLVEFLPGRRVAFAANSAASLLRRPRPMPVPGAPYYCLGLIPNMGHYVPLVQLGSLVVAEPVPQSLRIDYALCLRYECANGATEQGAVLVRGRLLEVRAGYCLVDRLPCDSDIWPLVCRQSMEYNQELVPVIEPELLFSLPLP